MDSEIRSLYSRLKEEVSVDNLKEISSDIIHAYKTRNYPLLQRYASCLGLDVESTEKNRLFSRLIQTYHPDKFNLIKLEIDSHFKNNDIEKADVLLILENLKYVNVVGNRIEDVELVQYLRERNTIVIY